MPRIIIFFFLLNFYNPVQSAIKEKIILQLENINTLSFNFIQTIGENKEDGNCILKYPKKIYCSYNNINKKIIVSNGKSLVIKNINSGTYYIYPLKKTPLNFLLDKKFLIQKIKSLNPRDVENKYLNFEISDNNNKINIFFDKETLNLLGWQTEDIYQNLTITFISLTEINSPVSDNMFRLPSID